MDLSNLENLGLELQKVAKEGLTQMHHLQANGNDDVKPAIEIFERINSALNTNDINELNTILSDVTKVNK